MRRRAARPRRGRLGRNVWAIGLVSLLTDTSSEMIAPLLPVFLTTVLGAGPLALGWVEGVAGAVASVLKLLSGRWSDRVGRRRPFVVGGYALSALARPAMALAAAPWHVVLVRSVDRTGKGLRSSPRDALLAASVPLERRGAAFGLHRAMDHAGALLGAAVAAALLHWSGISLRALFWWAALPGVAAVLVALRIEDVAAGPPGHEGGQGESSGGEASAADRPGPKAARASLASPLGALWGLLLPLGLFTLGNASDLFLLLRAGEGLAGAASLPLLWMVLHLVKSVSSLAAGPLADRVGRRALVVAGWLLYAAVYVGFAFAESRATIWGLFLVYGLYHGLTEGAERALVADAVPEAMRATAFGWYHLTVGLGSLAASVVFGGLWQRFGSSVAFLTSAALAVAAAVGLLVRAPRPAG